MKKRLVLKLLKQGKVVKNKTSRKIICEKIRQQLLNGEVYFKMTPLISPPKEDMQLRCQMRYGMKIGGNNGFIKII